VQWTTGNVAQQTVRAILARSDLELVGVFAHSPDKAGRDAADLCGLDHPTGVIATGNVDELLELGPDCVVYNALHLDVDEVASILRSGANVVTSSEFLTGGGLGKEARIALEEAALVGGASLFGSGMNPGFFNLVASVVSGASLGVRRVYASESVDVSLFAGDSNFDAFGWGHPPDEPGLAEAVEQATLVFRDGLEVLAAMLGLDQYEPRCRVDFALATKDLDLPGRPIQTGSVAGLDVRWEALQDEEAVIELHQRWVMSSDIEPSWTVQHGWVIEVSGDPRIRVKLEVWPDTEDLGSLTTSDFHAIGMKLTAAPLVNAIPYVCAAEPGLRTYTDLPTISTSFSANRAPLRST
jgi:2,4-diaminopentanoate dehydrogenase